MTVLHRVDAGPDRVPATLVALDVRGDRPVRLVRLLHRGRHLVPGELGRAGAWPVRHHAAGRHQLDRDDARLDLGAGGLADVVGAVGLEAHPVPWPPVIVITRPAVSIRGPRISPRSSIRRSAMSMWPTSANVADGGHASLDGLAQARADRMAVSAGSSAARTAPGSAEPSRQT